MMSLNRIPTIFIANLCTFLFVNSNDSIRLVPCGSQFHTLIGKLAKFVRHSLQEMNLIINGMTLAASAEMDRATLKEGCISQGCKYTNNQTNQLFTLILQVCLCYMMLTWVKISKYMNQ